MEKVISIYRRLSYFLNLFLLFIIGGALLLSYIAKGTFELWINAHNSVVLDNLFFYITDIGNGWVYVVFVLLVLVFKRPYFYVSAAAGLCCIAISATLKFLVFTGAARPPRFFEDNMHLHFVTGAPVLYANSFPSGHTLSAFSMFLMLSFIMEKKALQILFFILALSIGLSRMYLLAHFKEDVYAGAILGTGISFLVIYLFERFTPAGSLMQFKQLKVKVPE